MLPANSGVFGGGSRDLSLAWLGTAVVLAATAAIAAALLGALPWPELDHLGLAFLVLTGLFVLWNGASISWSLDPDRSWAYTNRGLVYLAFASLGLFAGAVVPRAPRSPARGPDRRGRPPLCGGRLDPPRVLARRCAGRGRGRDGVAGAAAGA